MHTKAFAAAALTVGLLLVVPGANAEPGRSPSTAVIAAAPQAANAGTPLTPRRACETPAPRHAACLAIIDADANGEPVKFRVHAGQGQTVAGQPGATAAFSPFIPYLATDLQAAYKLPSQLLGARQTVAIVDAYDDPKAAADLATYRAVNGLPTCDANFPCFKKVDQRGGTNYPAPDPEWATEESLDLDMASAVCPNCKIILVEADDNSDTSLAAAEDEAVALGANVISDSWGEAEFAGEEDLAAHFDHPGVAIVAASGDSGFELSGGAIGTSVPAAFPHVTAVGGTSLGRDPTSSRGWVEQAWTTRSIQDAAGSGCSVFVAKPAFQKDSLCRNRTVSDVSAVADPNTPVAVYDTYAMPGWIGVGGTSAAAPIIAGVFALAGNAGTVTNAYPYQHAGALFDVTDGPDNVVPYGAPSCGDSYLCAPTAGYDGPTGLGSPDGIGAF